MANTYTQLHVQTIFAVQDRLNQISPKWEEELYKYISAIVQNHNHKMLQINGMPDHLHLLIGMRPSQSLSDLIKQVKQSSSTWVNQRKLAVSKFTWQEGFSAFSYSKRDLPQVINYIRNQKEHHKKKTFREEYMALLKKYEIEYDEKYLFHFFD